MKRLVALLLCLLPALGIANQTNQEKYQKDIEQFTQFRDDVLGILGFVAIFNDDNSVKQVLSFSEEGDRSRRILVISNLKKADSLAQKIGYPNYDGWYWSCQEAVGQAKLLWSFLSFKSSSIVNTQEYADKSMMFKDAYKKCQQQRKNKPAP